MAMLRLCAASPLVSHAASTTDTAPAASPGPVGRYAVEGENPGGGDKYTGTVEATKAGDNYKVVWTIGDDSVVGTGIYGPKVFAVIYKDGKDTGLALCGELGPDWLGAWTVAGDTKQGCEHWVRQN
jgi:hypothetical protein